MSATCDACYTNCLDIEAAYGVKNSHARSRFFRFRDAQRAPLQRAGLWTNYKTSPSYTGTNVNAFAAACHRYVYGTSGARTEAMGLEMEHSDGSEPFMVNGHPATEMSAEELQDALRAPD